MISPIEIAETYVTRNPAGLQIIRAIHKDVRLHCDATEHNGVLILSVRASECNLFYHPATALYTNSDKLTIAFFGPDGSVDVSTIVGNVIYDDQRIRIANIRLEQFIKYVCNQIHMQSDHTKWQVNLLSCTVFSNPQ